MAGRSFLKIQRLTGFNCTSHRYFSKKIVQTKLSEIRSKIKQKEFDATFQFHKENYLQRYNLTPSKLFLEKHPILLTQRSVKEIKDLLYLLHKRCGFNEDVLLKVYNQYPSILELHPDDITNCLNRFKRLGFHHYEAFLRLEPSILLAFASNSDGNTVFLDRLKLYKDILEEIGVENGCELLEKHCVHLIQRDPKFVLGTMRFYEQFGLNIKELITTHPPCMVYTLSHVKKVVRFIHQHLSDIHGIDIKIIHACPHILGVNLEKLKKVIAWLKAVDLLQISEILEQCPELLGFTDVNKLDEAFKCLSNEYGVSRNLIKENLWLLLLKKDSIYKRMRVLDKFDLDVNETESIKLLQYDHNHIRRIMMRDNQ